VCSALLELFAIRAPTSDITMTLALALITFVMVNYYGVRKRGLFGRLRGIMLVPAAQVAEDAPRSVKRKANLKNIFQPTLIVFPIRVLSDLIIPLSLSCRLFGNMFGGMIIIEMLYYLLANYALGIPSAAGLFFNAFHPLLQAFIFITLSLNYIAEAADPEENE
jgi:F-type H+-transporting ATPase subunit a